MLPHPKLSTDFTGLHAEAVYKTLAWILSSILVLFLIGLCLPHRVAEVINMFCAGVGLLAAGVFAFACCSIMSGEQRD